MNRNPRLILAGLFAVFSIALIATTPPETTKNRIIEATKIQPTPSAAEKERDEAKAALQATQAQQQQLQVAVEYYKASSERDQAFLRLIGIQQQLEQAQRELAAAREEIAQLKKPTPPEPKK